METSNANDFGNMTVSGWLKTLNQNEHEVLLDKYSQQIKDFRHSLSSQDYIDISIDIFLMKTNKEALVDSYVNGDPIVDHPGCRFNEFLDKELVNRILQR